MKRTFTLEDIKKIIPHREPMLLIERAEEEEGIATAYYKIKGTEYFLDGHFPGMPVVPGVIQCEMMGQASCVLVEGAPGKTPFFTGMNNVKFRNKIVPGDEIRIVTQIAKQKGPFYFVAAKCFVGDTLCSEGDFAFVIA